MENKVKRTTTTILAETGNKEFKGIKYAGNMANGGRHNNSNNDILVWGEHPTNPGDTQRNNNVIITSKRHRDALT